MSPMNWGNLGLAMRELHRYEGAIGAFEVATALDPTYEPAWNEWANVLVDVRSYHAALLLYDRALSIDDTRAVVHHNRGVCLRMLGRISEAKSCFRAALQLEPTYHYSTAELAAC